MSASASITDREVRAFIKVGARGRKLSVGGGMFLLLSSAGTPLWRVKYRLGGKERLYSLGEYPNVSLSSAREQLRSVKEHLRQGRDPVQERRIERARATTATFNTFSGLASEWLEDQRKGWSGIHYRKSKRAIERDVLPHLGNLPVAKIEPIAITSMIKAILARGVRDTAAKILQHVTDMFEYARAHGLRDDNPAKPAQTILPKADAPKGRPAFLTWAELGNVLRGAEAAHLSPAVRMANRLIAFTAARISNVVEADWKEFDLEGDTLTWTIPRVKMKVPDRTHDHKIILGPTIAADLRAWRTTKGGNGFVFPSPAGGKHITREALEKAYRETLGLAERHSPHGWRAALSTLARESGFERDVVELALDHVHDNDVVRAYDRGERLVQRVKLMQWWDEQLAKAQRGAEITPIGGARAGIR